jgi:hypothetical protein
VAAPGVLDIKGLDPNQRDALAVLTSAFDSFGLGSLAKTILQYVKNGWGANEIGFALQSTPQYQQRFSGNADRQKAGLPPLSPADYIATERSYRQVLSAAGLPPTFYTSQSALASLIGRDISPAELQSRAQIAQRVVSNSDPSYLSALQQYHGIDAGHLAAHFLDPKEALPILQQQSAAADIGAAALRNNLGLTNEKDAMLYAAQGVTAGQAANAYQSIGQYLPIEQGLAARFGTTYDQSTAEAEALGGSAAAAQKRLGLNKNEQALFQGGSGVGNSLYHPDYGLQTNEQGTF